MSAKHTPGSLVTLGRLVLTREPDAHGHLATVYAAGGASDDANAAELVRRWNAHEDLLAKLEKLQARVDEWDLLRNPTPRQLQRASAGMSDAAAAARAAIARARGGK